MPLGYQGGEGGEEVENNYGEGVPVAENKMKTDENSAENLLELRQCTG